MKIKRNQHAEVVLKLFNRSPSTITLVYPTSKKFDFQVLAADGNEVYVWSRSKVFLETLTKMVVPPHSHRGSTLKWEVELPPGRYVLVGTSNPIESQTLNKIHVKSNEATFEVTE